MQTFPVQVCRFPMYDLHFPWQGFKHVFTMSWGPDQFILCSLQMWGLDLALVGRNVSGTPSPGLVMPTDGYGGGSCSSPLPSGLAGMTGAIPEV